MEREREGERGRTGGREIDSAEYRNLHTVSLCNSHWATVSVAQ